MCNSPFFCATHSNNRQELIIVCDKKLIFMVYCYGNGDVKSYLLPLLKLQSVLFASILYRRDLAGELKTKTLSL